MQGVSYYLPQLLVWHKFVVLATIAALKVTVKDITTKQQSALTEIANLRKDNSSQSQTRALRAGAGMIRRKYDMGKNVGSAGASNVVSSSLQGSTVRGGATQP